MFTLLSLLFLSTSSAENYKSYEVSVCKDATYWVSDKPCAGSGKYPTGSACPKAGDYTTKDCHKYLKSWIDYDAKCIAPEDAECKKIHTGAWSCVFPSIGCDYYKPTYPPTYEPTYHPTPKPTYPPTYKPTYHPTYKPTYHPTPKPTYPPTYKPTYEPIYPCDDCDYYWEYPDAATYDLYPDEKEAVELNVIKVKGEYEVNYIYYSNGTRANNCVPYYAAYLDEYKEYVDYFKGTDGSTIHVLDIFYTKTAYDAGKDGDYDILYRAAYEKVWGDYLYVAAGNTFVIKMKCDGYYDTCVTFDTKEYKYEDKNY